MAKLTKKTVEAVAPTERDRFLWDDELHGFGLRVKPSGVRSFIVQYRTHQGVSKRITLGQFGRITVEEARRAAKTELARVALGADPRTERNESRNALTLGQLADRYLSAVEAGSVVTRSGRPKAKSTIEIDRGRILRHIRPVIGSKLVRDLTQADVRRLFEAVKLGKTAADERTGRLRGRSIVEGGAGTAKKAVRLLSAVLSFGVDEGLADDNPAKGFRLPKDGRRVVEDPAKLFAALGRAMQLADKRAEPWQATYLVSLVALTGLRRGEAVDIRWNEVDFVNRALRLTATKSGPSVRPLSLAARALLWNLRLRAEPAVVRTGGPVFPASRRGEGSFGGLPRAFLRITSAPELSAEDRETLDRKGLHHLRHAMATLGDQMGLSLPTLGVILGHSVRGTTAGYVTRRVDPFVLAEADRLADAILELLSPEEEAQPERALALEEMLAEAVEVSDVLIA